MMFTPILSSGLQYGENNTEDDRPYLDSPAWLLRRILLPERSERLNTREKSHHMDPAGHDEPILAATSLIH